MLSVTNSYTEYEKVKVHRVLALCLCVCFCSFVAKMRENR